ncbi:hypothetical protein B296_00009891 [Ensete ventricosum]|uniref:Longin domain-containing protein n=1 Tax=Ensete ventricosum TaxID=4639 RepID=A0A426ZX32_ENSVE|nr:hypothetical protein B296_00009891 [Ensete ventricosum]
MGQQSLIYSFVSRGTVILAEYTEFSGNFNSIAAQCLQKLPASNNKFTYNCDGHTFNYLVEDGYSECPGSRSGRFRVFARLDPSSSRFLACCEVFPRTCLRFNKCVAPRGNVVSLFLHSVYAIILSKSNNLIPAKVESYVLSWCLSEIMHLAAYCVVAVESVGRQIPIAFLERVKEEFNKKYGGGKAATASANSLNREFG